MPTQGLATPHRLPGEPLSRAAQHGGRDATRRLSGILRILLMWTGLPMDVTARPHFDGREDHTTLNGTIDDIVCCADHTTHLLTAVKHGNCDLAPRGRGLE